MLNDLNDHIKYQTRLEIHFYHWFLPFSSHPWIFTSFEHFLSIDGGRCGRPFSYLSRLVQLFLPPHPFSWFFTAFDLCFGCSRLLRMPQRIELDRCSLKAPMKASIVISKCWCIHLGRISALQTTLRERQAQNAKII